MVFGREQKQIREKRREGEEEEEEEEEKRRRKKEEGRRQEIKGMDLYGFLWIRVWNLLGTFVGILYGYLFGVLEYFFLCRLLVWNGCLIWLWSSMEEKFV